MGTSSNCSPSEAHLGYRWILQMGWQQQPFPEEGTFPWHGLGCLGKLQGQTKEQAPAAVCCSTLREHSQHYSAHGILWTTTRAGELQSHRKVYKNQGTSQKFRTTDGKSSGVIQKSSKSQIQPPSTFIPYLCFSPGHFFLSGLPLASEARRILESFAAGRIKIA